MSRNWTIEQKQAIESRNGSILVSAAAGSGKTAVLVERVIQRIVDENNKCPADNLLIVTFTNAAAREMRERISNALDKRIKNDIDNIYLRQQQMLLPDAQICTIDSFCNTLVRENFQALDISPDYRIVDRNELTILYNRAMDSCLEKQYKTGDENFRNLVELLFSGRDDSRLAEYITDIYNYSMAYPFPEDWLDTILDSYNADVNIFDSCWGKSALDYCLSAAYYCRNTNRIMEQIIRDDELLSKVYGQAVASDLVIIDSFIEKLENKDWDSAARIAREPVFIARGKLPSDMKECLQVKLLNAYRDEIKYVFKSKLSSALCVSQQENSDDIRFLYPLVKKLTETVKLFSDELMKLKREEQCFDFSDVSHLALGLLVERLDRGEYRKTPLAVEISKRYREILIDEYQDTNFEQDMIFRAISDRDNNLFRVGDVKQSIYSFRQAMPEIFLELRNRLEKYSDENYPAKIILDRNFRSRKGVTSYINFIFSQIMSRETGGVDYNVEERLICQAEYPETNEHQAELHIIDTDKVKNESATNEEIQAEYVASLVKDILSSGRLIKDADRLRPVKKRDICILLRSVKNSGKVFADAMRRWGIDCYTDISGSFFTSTEISVMLSLLCVIDNPIQDIPLMSVMMSPIFSFTADEMAQIRINNRRDNLYACLIKEESTNEKVRDFLRFFRRMRYFASTCTAGDLIRKIYDETSFTSIVQAMTDADVRRSNLMLLIDYAVTYEKSGMIGLSGLIRFIDKLREHNKELDSLSTVSENADVVRIMTVHKSKGLEFPICILADAQKKFNLLEESGNLIINPDNGIGIKRRNFDNMSEYETLPHSVARLTLDNASKREEMRILYVALTRAKEDLIIVANVKNIEKTVIELSQGLNTNDGKYLPFSILSKNNYADWVIKAMLRHKDCMELRNICGLGEGVVIKSDFSLKTVLVTDIKEFTEKATVVESETEIDNEIQKFISERVNYEYKYAPLAGIPTKTAASHLDSGVIDRENFAVKKPSFLENGKLTGAQRGTATHKFMERCDFKRAALSLEDEIENLYSRGILTQDEKMSINREKLSEFFSSQLAKRIMRSEQVFREKKFTVNMPLDEMYPNTGCGENETVMIQGMIDCAFSEEGELVVVDYKTDRVNNAEELKEKYRKQVEIYRYALEQITGKKVKEICIYSFALSQMITV